MKCANQSLSVLLVEDERIVSHIHSTLLKNMGCSVDTAFNGNEAFTKSNDHYDLIFMDVGLPDITGIEVMSKIRETGNQTPIVVLTAYTGSDVKNKCFAAGADAVFTKPISVEKLGEILKDFVNK